LDRNPVIQDILFDKGQGEMELFHKILSMPIILFVTTSTELPNHYDRRIDSSDSISRLCIAFLFLIGSVNTGKLCADASLVFLLGAIVLILMRVPIDIYF
jgi:hypothetical protein